ncbi:ribonuclease E/G [Poseidonocella sp. HB161398]|uniref:Rne/Rng family ribonuclease n=1 Tax=Poseidonocella sp. HB161398 TaxID=2320855 RepID=UPI001109C6D9|nr:ribonuclease E/G [Poseidonocella sp. HB161398]
MAKKMLIDATHPEETRVVVVDGSKVEEFDFESENKRQLAGNIYLAKVTRVEPSLQAAFVDYGGNRHGFLAFSEIHPDYYQIPVADREALMAEERAYAESLKDDEDGEDGQRRSRRRTRKSKDGDEAKPARSRSRSKAKDAAEKAPEAPRETGKDRAIPGMDVVDLDPEDDPLLSPVGEQGGMAVVSAEETSEAPVEAVADAAVSSEAPAGAVEIPIATPAAEAPEAAAEAPAELPEPAAAEEAAPAEAEAEAPAEPDAAEEAPEAETPAGEEPAAEAEEDEKPADDTPPSYMAASGPSDFVASQEVSDTGADEDDGQSEVPLHENEPEEAEHDDTIEDVETDDIEEEVEEARRPRSKPRPRRYKIQEVIKVRQIMLVQVVKEERGNKGAALTTYLSLAGRYCVLMPNTARGGGISRKITQAADRKKLKQIATELDVPEGAGLIIRTAGAKRTKSEIKRDYEYLQRLWEQIRQLALKSFAPAKIYEEGDLIKRSIRDLYNREIDEVLVEGEAGYRNAKDFMKMIMPSHAKNVQQYTDPLPLFARHQVESYLDGMFNPVVRLKSGGYIVIGVTEALVAIDVNSGKATKEGSIEQTALNTNLEAAEEVARQLRLRDLAGLIVIDFIDMEERKNNAAVEKRFKEKLKTDRARIQVGRISGFGLLEMSRQRLRPGMIEATTQPCHHCHGTGLIRSDDSLALSILRQIEEEGVRRRSREVLVKCPVGIANYLMNNKRLHIANIEMRYGLSVRVESDPSLINPDFTVERFKTATRAVPVPSAPVISVDTSDLPEIDEEELLEADLAEEQEQEVAAAPEKEAAAEDDQPKRRRRRRRRRKGGPNEDGSAESDSQSYDGDEDDDSAEDGQDDEASGSDDETEGSDDQPKRRRRRRGGRGRRRPGGEDGSESDGEGENGEDDEAPAAAVTAAPAESAEPATETAVSDAPAEPVADAPAEPVAEPVAEAPAEAEPRPEPVAEAAAEPEAEVSAEPVAETAPEPEAEAPAEPVAETPAEPEPAAPEAAEEPAAPEPEPAPEAPAEPEPQVAETPAAPAPEPEPELETASAEPAKPKRRGWWSVD